MPTSGAPSNPTQASPTLSASRRDLAAQGLRGARVQAWQRGRFTHRGVDGVALGLGGAGPYSTSPGKPKAAAEPSEAGVCMRTRTLRAFSALGTGRGGWYALDVCVSYIDQ